MSSCTMEWLIVGGMMAAWMLWEDCAYHDDGRKEMKQNLIMNVSKPNGNTIGCRVNEP